VLLAQAFLRAAYQSGVSSAGEAAVQAVRTVSASHPFYRSQARSYVFMGDPLLPLPHMNRPVVISRGRPNITVCPAGDGDTLRIDVSSPTLVGYQFATMPRWVFAVRRPGAPNGPRVWDCVTPTTPNGDTLRVRGYNAASGTLSMTAAAISGTGLLDYDVYMDGRLIASDISFAVRSFDMDGLCSGSVDKYDFAALRAAMSQQGSTVGDFDWSGATNSADSLLFARHYSNNGCHHVRRQLVAPNGGGPGFGFGQMMDVAWKPGVGDSSRVTLKLTRDRDASATMLMAANLTDNGYYRWLIPNTVITSDDYRVRLELTAGATGGQGSSIGQDASDTTFVIAGNDQGGGGGGGCPFVDTYTATGWQTENSILGRSLSAAMGLDAYRLKWSPASDSGCYHLRIRENEQEVTTLDQVRLVAVDHVPELRAYSDGERVVLGVPLPATSVTSSSGQDVTHLVDGSAPQYFTGAPGETLLIRNGPMQGAARAERIEGGGDGPLLTSAGYKDCTDCVRARGAPGYSAVDLDALVLASTGLIVQTPDGQGGWHDVGHLYPRAEFDDCVVDSARSGESRIVFVGRHEVRFLGQIQVATDSLTAQKLLLVGAEHSRLGDVRAAIDSIGNVTTTLSPQDTLLLDFEAPPVAPGEVRDLFLLSRGVYTSNLPARSMPIGTRVPAMFALEQNRPNPFGRTTAIRFTLPVDAPVRVDIFDLQGRRVRTVAAGDFRAGYYSVDWDRVDATGSSVGPGVYLYRILAGRFRAQRKMVVLP
jgi:hypothetical protein